MIENEFNNFLSSIQKKTKKVNESKLISFAFKIPQVEISSLTNYPNLKKENYFYWKIASENEEFLGFDSVLNINEFGEDRISKIAGIINDVEKNFLSNWDTLELSNLPLIMGGNKFAPNQKSENWKDFSDADWFIPKYLFYKCEEGTYAVFNFYISIDKKNINSSFYRLIKIIAGLNNDFDPSENKIKDPVYSNSVDKWEGAVNLALQKITDGIFSKVVLSREVCLELQYSPNVPKLLNGLSIKYPRCYTFAFKKNNSLFLGASPEKLAKFSNNLIEVDALAGSAPRGKNLQEDLEYENFLLNSEKNLNEQQTVVSFINQLLENITENINYEEKPIIRKLPNIQHLWTVIKAKLKTGYNLFDVLKELHPTPAICGTPWKTARNFILDIEPHDRGLYSGNIGWFNFNGSGEFAVAIRSALIKDKKLFAYAGCGIVEGSEPDLEFEESEIKLKPILSLFADEKIYQS